ncbi:hypothetical protein L6452_40636 [Arctium lappa]|uniref:Uncharacterized protein n=1 Tax=Arctium lappa TaxID=4217 RepID=A0ACB8XMG4_ARCLA|nr:hypothetical protein L6452_40636 [Arctium lappa]
MSNPLLSMGSRSKPPVLMADEYQQWKKRMIQFLNLKNRAYMESIINCPVNPIVRVQGQVETDTSLEIPDRYVRKPYQYFSEKERDQYKIDEEALIYLTMAIPNDIYNGVDSRNSTKEVWDELSRQFEVSEASIQAKQNLCINAYEGFHAKEGETLLETYNRYNIILNDLRRNNISKSASEINYKFIKNLNPEWKNFAINLQLSKNMAQENVTDIFSTLSQNEDEVRTINLESNKLKDSVALIADNAPVSSARSKRKMSKALVTEVTDSDSVSSDEELEIDSDPDIQKFSEDLALITRRFKKTFGKKKFYSKPKYEGHKKEKAELRYKPRHLLPREERREDRKEDRREDKREKRKKTELMNQEDATTVENLGISQKTADSRRSRIQTIMRESHLLPRKLKKERCSWLKKKNGCSKVLMTTSRHTSPKFPTWQSWTVTMKILKRILKTQTLR